VRHVSNFEIREIALKAYSERLSYGTEETAAAAAAAAAASSKRLQRC